MTMEDRRLAAILFSDICGFSRSMGSDEDRALNYVAVHVETVRNLADRYKGRIIKQMGDGLLVEFPSAVHAVRCALDVQKSIARHNRRAVEADRFQIRIGIHLGDVVIAEDDILGDGVNVASRIEPLAEPGGICISRDIFDLVKNKIELATVHLGAPELKNISRKISIYKVIVEAFSGEPSKPIAPTDRKAGKSPRWGVIVPAAAAAILAVVLIWTLVPKPHAPESGGANPDPTAAVEKTEPDSRTTPPPASKEKTTPPPAKEAETPKTAPAGVNPNIETETGRKIIQRYLAFLKSIQKRDLDGARAVIAPESRGRFRASGSRPMIRRLLNFVGSKPLGPDKVRIRSLTLSPENDRAEVVFEFHRESGTGGASWRAGRLTRWARTADQWHLLYQPPR